jgi:hypothetical protein
MQRRWLEPVRRGRWRWWDGFATGPAYNGGEGWRPMTDEERQQVKEDAQKVLDEAEAAEKEFDEAQAQFTRLHDAGKEDAAQGALIRAIVASWALLTDKQKQALRGTAQNPPKYKPPINPFRFPRSRCGRRLHRNDGVLRQVQPRRLPVRALRKVGRAQRHLRGPNRRI